MSASLTPAERTLRAKIAVETSWANTADRSARTKPARDALAAKFEAEVDPDGILDPDERARRAEHARRAHFHRMALASARARRRRAGKAADPAAGADTPTEAA